DRANNRHTVHDAGRVRHQFAHVTAGQRRSDLLEFAANFTWRVRLHVRQFELTGRPVKVEKDAGLRLAKRRVLCRIDPRSAGAKMIGQREAKEAQPAGPQCITPTWASAEPFLGSEDAEHVRAVKTRRG